MKSLKHATVVTYQPTRYFGVLCLGAGRSVLLQEVFALRKGIRLSTALSHIHVSDEIFPLIRETHVTELGV